MQILDGGTYTMGRRAVIPQIGIRLKINCQKLKHFNFSSVFHHQFIYSNTVTNVDTNEVETGMTRLIALTVSLLRES